MLLHPKYAKDGLPSVRYGRSPFDKTDSYFEKPDDVWVVKPYRHRQSQVSKNRLTILDLELSQTAIVRTLLFGKAARFWSVSILLIATLY
jgi:hypothetical protein